MFIGLHFSSKKTGKLSIGFEDLSRNSVFFSNLMIQNGIGGGRQNWIIYETKKTQINSVG